jgi:protein-tyrosine phosphatase
VLRVLLVCTGNICRSPIAHGLLAERSRRLLGGGIEVRSVGTWARGGFPATPEAVIAAGDLGVDLSAHRSSRFAAELADWADLIVTMTTEQTSEVAKEAPRSAAKTFALKEVVPILGSLQALEGEPEREALLERVAEADRARGGAPQPVDGDVADPLGLSQATYLAVAHELEGLIDDLVRGLVGDHPAALAKES